MINLKDGWVEVSDKSQKHYCFEVNQIDEVSGKHKSLYLGAKTWDSYNNWFEAFKVKFILLIIVTFAIESYQ
jgi:hypothetical protein